MIKIKGRSWKVHQKPTDFSIIRSWLLLHGTADDYRRCWIKIYRSTTRVTAGRIGVSLKVGGPPRSWGEPSITPVSINEPVGPRCRRRRRRRRCCRRRLLHRRWKTKDCYSLVLYYIVLYTWRRIAAHETRSKQRKRQEGQLERSYTHRGLVGAMVLSLDSR